MPDWDDLRFFLGVADHGSTLAAGVALNSSQSTVFRRIGALEQALGLALFERRASGYALTAAGEALLPLARQVEAAVAAFNQGADLAARQSLTVIRFSAPDAAIDYLLAPVKAAFRERCPEVRLEVIASPRQLDLARGEADVALRANPASDPELFGRRLVQERPTLVASHAYAQRRGLPRSAADFTEHDFIDLTGVLAQMLGSWFETAVPKERIILQPDGIASTLSAARSGLGLAVLPQFIVDREASLVAAPVTMPVSPSELWVVTHQRLRGSAPVRALMEVVADYVLATTSAVRQID